MLVSLVFYFIKNVEFNLLITFFFFYINLNEIIDDISNLTISRVIP